MIWIAAYMFFDINVLTEGSKMDGFSSRISVIVVPSPSLRTPLCVRLRLIAKIGCDGRKSNYNM